MICKGCSKNVEILKDNLCSTCYFAQNNPLIGLESLNITFCVTCSEIFFKEKLIGNKNIKDALVDLITQKIKLKKGVELKGVKLSLSIPAHEALQRIKVQIKARAIIDVTCGDLQTKLDLNFPVKLKYIVCMKCSKESSGYFEGILQLRNPRKEVVKFITEKMAKQKAKHIFITKKETVKNGEDFYFTDQRYLQSFARKVVQHFGGVLTVSAKLHTRDRQTMKNLYRVTALVRLYDFSVGDVVEYEGALYVVSSLTEVAKLKSLEIDKTLTLKDVSNAKKYKLVVNAEVISVRPNFEILHPESFQSIPIRNAKGLVLGKKVKVAVKEQEAFLV